MFWMHRWTTPDVLFSVVTPEEFGVPTAELSTEQVDALTVQTGRRHRAGDDLQRGNQEIDANTHPLLKSLSANLRNPLR